VGKTRGDESLSNLGHRLGGLGSCSGNTIESLRATIDKVSDPLFLYWEFDVHESADGILFVYHDNDIEMDGEMVLVKGLEMESLKNAGVQLGFQIPTFTEVISELSERNENTMIEIKNLISDEARREVITAMVGHPNWTLMATPLRFTASFPSESRAHWHSEVRKAGTKLVRVGRHRIDLFSAAKTRLGWMLAKPKWLFGF
jgi:glycerophosphoryl diester phosphodiesterase|tara:strand:- start:244 stop:846 length:603 start_codon:yes stop_codon:yes gene_type:complete